MAHDDIEDIVSRAPWRPILVAGAAAILFFAILYFDRNLAVDIIQSALTALLFAAIAFCYARYKNWTVESGLRRSLAPNGVSTRLVNEKAHVTAFGVTIRNRTGRTVVVRDVEFFTAESTRHSISPNLLGSYPHVIQPNFRTDITTTCIVTDTGRQDFVELPPFTEATWGLMLSHSDDDFLECDIRGCSVVFEYEQLWGDHTLVRVRSSKSVSDMMNRCWLQMRNKYNTHQKDD